MVQFIDIGVNLFTAARNFGYSMTHIRNRMTYFLGCIGAFNNFLVDILQALGRTDYIFGNLFSRHALFIHGCGNGGYNLAYFCDDTCNFSYFNYCLFRSMLNAFDFGFNGLG